MSIFLDTTSKSVQAKMGTTKTTTEPTYFTSAGVISTANFAVLSTPSLDGSLNDTTPVTIVASPGASQTVSVQEITLYNLDTITQTLTVILKDGANSFNLASASVPSGSFLRYTDKTQWQVGTSGGTSGTVTSVALTTPTFLTVTGSPITTSGTLAVSLATQSANLVFAGPTTGVATAPTFRALVTADMPAGTGTVTSVALTAPAIFTVTGTPITTSGTLAVTLATQNANLVWAGPTSGGAATPTFRSLVAADIPSLSSTYLPLAGGTMAGAISLPNASAATPELAFNTNYGLFYDATNTGMSVAANGSELLTFTSSGISQLITGGGTSQLNVYGEGVVTENFGRISTNAVGPLVSFYKGRGTFSSATVAALNDSLGSFSFRAVTTAAAITPTNIASNTTIGCSIVASLIETGTVSPTAVGSQIRINACAIGSGTNSNVAIFDSTNGWQAYSNISVLDLHGNYTGSSVALAYQRVVPVTGFSQTISNNVSALVLKPAGTLATGTITMPATPVDGQEVMITSTQTITALTVNANTGQTISAPLSAAALTAATPVKWKYIATDTNWYRAV